MEEWGHAVLDRVTKKACCNEVKFEKNLDQRGLGNPGFLGEEHSRQRGEQSQRCKLGKIGARFGCQRGQCVWRRMKEGESRGHEVREGAGAGL